VKLGQFAIRYVLALLVFNLAACSTLQPVSVERAMQAGPPAGVDHGSLVRVKTLDGRRLEFRVTEITPEGLGGSPGFVRYADMDSLAVRQERAPGDAAAWVLGILGVAALVALIANADQVSICSPSPCPAPQP